MDTEEEIICTHRLPTKDLTTRELIKRDRFLREEHGFSEFTSTDSYNTEHQVMTEVVNSYCYHLGFPYLYGYEYECVPGYSQYGRGDLVFTDGNARFIAVECKRLEFGVCARGARTKQKSKVTEQARKYRDRLVSHLDQQKIKYTGEIRGIAVVNNSAEKLEKIGDYTEPHFSSESTSDNGWFVW